MKSEFSLASSSSSVISCSLSKVLQPHHPSCRRWRQGLGKWRAIHCGRWLGLGLFKWLFLALKVHESVGLDDTHPSVGSEGLGWVNGYTTIHHIWDIMAVQHTSFWLERGNHNPQFYIGKYDTGNYRPVSPPYLAKSCNRSSWKLCQSMWRIRRWLVLDNTASLKVNCAQQIRQPSTLWLRSGGQGKSHICHPPGLVQSTGCCVAWYPCL